MTHFSIRCIIKADQEVSGKVTSSEQTWTDRTTTPNQILERTRAVVEQMNEQARSKEEALSDAGVALRHNQ